MATKLTEEECKKAADEVRAELTAALQEEGVDSRYIAQKIKEGCEARMTRHFAHQGVVINTRTLIDYRTRRDYLHMVAQIRGDYAPEKQEHTVTIEDKLRELQKKKRTN